MTTTELLAIALKLSIVLTVLGLKTHSGRVLPVASHTLADPMIRCHVRS
jgi:hypothetical protein